MRIFIAIQLDIDTKKQLHRMVEKLIPFFSKARCSNIENYHITLKFIGEVGKEEYNKVLIAVKTAASGINKFSIFINGTGSFKKRNKHIIYGSIKESSELKKLYSAIHKELEELKVVCSENKFTPHITLARDVIFKDGYPGIENEKSEIKVSSISVMESTRVNGRLKYIPQFTVNLKGK